MGCDFLMEKLRNERKANGLCVQCGVRLDRVGRYCEKCNDAANIIKRKRCIWLYSVGFCTNCAEPMDREGWFCLKCANNLKLKARIRNTERRLRGLCIQCGVWADGYSYCQRCRDMRMERYYLKRKKKEGNRE